MMNKLGSVFMAIIMTLIALQTSFIDISSGEEVIEVSGLIEDTDIFIDGQTQYLATGNLTLQASGNITVQGDIIASPPSENETGISITLNASGDITIYGKVIASNGSDGSNDISKNKEYNVSHGCNGGNVIIISGGDTTIVNGAVVASGNGGKGGSVVMSINENISENISVTAGNGGNGGSINITVSRFDLNGTIMIGNGGHGGATVLVGKANVTATGGNGGKSGVFKVNTPLNESLLDLYYNKKIDGGIGGRGGDAYALYSNSQIANKCDYEISEVNATIGNIFPWKDDVESYNTLWNATGLWHITNRTSGPMSLNYSWWYGNETTNDYDTGNVTFGNITSPLISLPNTSVMLSFWTKWEIESMRPEEYDLMKVMIYHNDTWNTVLPINEMFRGEHNPEIPWVSNGSREDNYMVYQEVDISSYKGQTIQVRFSFDSQDGQYNDFEGWYVDDILIGYENDDMNGYDMNAYIIADIDIDISIDVTLTQNLSGVILVPIDGEAVYLEINPPEGNYDFVCMGTEDLVCQLYNDIPGQGVLGDGIVIIDGFDFVYLGNATPIGGGGGGAIANDKDDIDYGEDGDDGNPGMHGANGNDPGDNGYPGGGGGAGGNGGYAVAIGGNGGFGEGHGGDGGNAWAYGGTGGNGGIGGSGGNGADGEQYYPWQPPDGGNGGNGGLGGEGGKGGDADAIGGDGGDSLVNGGDGGCAFAYAGDGGDGGDGGGGGNGGDTFVSWGEPGEEGTGGEGGDPDFGGTAVGWFGHGGSAPNPGQDGFAIVEQGTWGDPGDPGSSGAPGSGNS